MKFYIQWKTRIEFSVVIAFNFVNLRKYWTFKMREILFWCHHLMLACIILVLHNIVVPVNSQGSKKTYINQKDIYFLQVRPLALKLTLKGCLHFAIYRNWTLEWFVIRKYFCYSRTQPMTEIMDIPSFLRLTAMTIWATQQINMISQW